MNPEHICAWCDPWRWIEPDGSRGRVVDRAKLTGNESHGICKPCMEQAKKEVKTNANR